MSRLTKPKNLTTLIRSVAACAQRLRRARAHLRVVGDGPERRRLVQVASSLGVQDLVTFVGPTHLASVWMARADWLLISSVAEGGPLTVYEGLQSGLRIMATPVGAIPDVLAQDHASILLSGASRQAITGGLQQLMDATPRLADLERERRRALGDMWSASCLAPSWYEALASVT